jgi:hypothetical protein
MVDLTGRETLLAAEGLASPQVAAVSPADTPPPQWSPYFGELQCGGHSQLLSDAQCGCVCEESDREGFACAPGMNKDGTSKEPKPKWGNARLALPSNTCRHPLQCGCLSAG